MIFEEIFKKLAIIEGGWVNDPLDKGKETYKGISRHFNPDWLGWKIIDDVKRSKEFPAILEKIPALQEHVINFYKKEYWDKYSLGDLPNLIGEEIFECAVNTGSEAIEIVQKTCNILNRNQKLYADIKVDGQWGVKTKTALNLCIQKNGIPVVYKVLNLFQGLHYINLMTLNKEYEKYIGWFNRVKM